MATRLATIAEDTVAALERQPWLEPIEERVQRAVIGAFESAGAAGQAVKNFLHGTWLGHPLHPVLTDIPIGAWTAAVVLDVMEARAPHALARRQYAKGADTCIAVGIAGAAGSALTGLTDWTGTSAEPRRTGLVHAALNTTALACYVASLLLRRRGRRSEARALAYVGAGVVSAGAYLGGSLVYKNRVGVDHSETATADGFMAAIAERELEEGRMHRVVVNGTRVLIVRRLGRIYAINEVCSHMGGPLADGVLEGSSVRCPWHGSRFALDDGSVLDGPATTPQTCWDSRVRNGQVELRPRRGGATTSST